MSTASTTTRISICVLNWQTPQTTISCIRQLLSLPDLKESTLQCDLIIIDNGSEDGSAEQLKAATADSPNCHLICSPHNLGYAGGNNLGIKYALKRLNPDYIWLLNSDTLPQPESLRHLVLAARQSPQTAIWGSTLIDAENGRIECAGGCYYNPWLTTYRRALHNQQPHTTTAQILKKPVDYIAGAALFIDASLFNEIGLLNEAYFLFFEELDLARRLPEGRSQTWCHESTIVHQSGGSMVYDDRNCKTTADYHATLSALIYTQHYYPRRLIIALPFRLLAKCTQHLARGHLAAMRCQFQACVDFITKQWEE